MASAQENAATIRRGYELFNSGNLDDRTQLFAEDVVWHTGGRGRLAGDKRGRDGRVIEAWEHYEDSQTWDEFSA